MDAVDELIGRSAQMTALRAQIRALLAREANLSRLPPLLITGETGTGKGLVARIIHRRSSRSRRAVRRAERRRHPRDTSSSPSCSDTSAAPSPTPAIEARGCSRWRIAARCSSTRWACCRSPSRPSCSRSSRTTACGAWARRGASPSTSGSSARRTRISPRPVRAQAIPRGSLPPARGGHVWHSLRSASAGRTSSCSPSRRWRASVREVLRAGRRALRPGRPRRTAGLSLARQRARAEQPHRARGAAVPESRRSPSAALGLGCDRPRIRSRGRLGRRSTADAELGAPAPERGPRPDRVEHLADGGAPRHHAEHGARADRAASACAPGGRTGRGSPAGAPSDARWPRPRHWRDALADDDDIEHVRRMASDDRPRRATRLAPPGRMAPGRPSIAVLPFYVEGEDPGKRLLRGRRRGGHRRRARLAPGAARHLAKLDASLSRRRRRRPQGGRERWGHLRPLRQRAPGRAQLRVSVELAETARRGGGLGQPLRRRLGRPVRPAGSDCHSGRRHPRSAGARGGAPAGAPQATGQPGGVRLRASRAGPALPAQSRGFRRGAHVAGDGQSRSIPAYAAPYALLAAWHGHSRRSGMVATIRRPTTRRRCAWPRPRSQRDSFDAMALALCGHTKSLLLHEFDEAIALFDRAIEASPSSDIRVDAEQPDVQLHR